MIARIKAWSRHSLTIAWARLVAFLGALLALADQLAEILATPEVQAQLQAVLSPKVWPFLMLLIGIVTELARRRSLKKE